jgi:hypothetical protein
MNLLRIQAKSIWLKSISQILIYRRVATVAQKFFIQDKFSIIELFSREVEAAEISASKGSKNKKTCERRE